MEDGQDHERGSRLYHNMIKTSKVLKQSSILCAK